MIKIKQFLKEIFDIEGIPDEVFYTLIGIFILIIVLGLLGII